MIPAHANIIPGTALDHATAKQTVASLKTRLRDTETLEDLFYSQNPWRDPLHIAATEVRTACAPKLLGDDSEQRIGLIDILLAEEIPDIAFFHGIFDVDSIGLWYYYVAESTEEETWQQRVIPWNYVRSLTLHPLTV